MSIAFSSEGNTNTWWFYNWEVFLGEAKQCQQHISKGNFKSFFCIYILKFILWKFFRTRMNPEVKGSSCLMIWRLTAYVFLYDMYKTKCFPTNPLSFKIKFLIWSLSLFYFMLLSFCVTT
jgi:hypothetical protein